MIKDGFIYRSEFSIHSMKNEKLHILLVEDEEIDAEVVCRSFKESSENYNIFVTTRIFGAKAHISDSTPHIVITDLFLPDGSGMELLTSEKSEARYPLIVMSGRGDEEKAVDAMKAGAFDYLVKSQKSLTFRRICIKVKDTGGGLPKDKMDKVFKSFYRMENESTNTEGTGICLNIPKGLIEVMGGSIKVDSVLGEGSCFSICLPSC